MIFAIIAQPYYNANWLIVVNICNLLQLYRNHRRSLVTDLCYEMSKHCVVTFLLICCVFVALIM